jgi:glycosyltransferase involved in cell wall biosynthesis
MPQHILLYTDVPETGGVAQSNHAILSRLIDRGYQVTCVQGKSNSVLIQQQQQLGICHEWLPFDPGEDFKRSLINRQEVAAIFEKIQPDLILFSDRCPVSHFAAKQVALHFGAPCVISLDFVAPDLAEQFSTYLRPLAVQFSQVQAVITTSQSALDLLHEQFQLPKHHGQVIYPGRLQPSGQTDSRVERDRLRQELQIPTDAVICFTAAPIEATQGFEYQLQAIAQLQHSPIWQNLYFIWAGEGSLKAPLAARVEQLGIADRVKLVQQSDDATWYDAIDLFLLPSCSAGMPLAAIEAMARAIPVVASAVGGLPEMLGDTGKLLPDPNVDAQTTVNEIVKTIQTWAESSIREAVGQDCQQRAKRMFRTERMVQETIAVIEQPLSFSESQVFSESHAFSEPHAFSESHTFSEPYTFSEPQKQESRSDLPQESLSQTSSYTKDFYELLQAGSRSSARVILPLLLELLQSKPQSVIDVGCGVATWLGVFQELGIEDCLGVDGDYVDPKMLQIPVSQFMAADLRQPLAIDRQFSLAMSLEVAEHLPADCAEGFVHTLTELAPIVLFSAAIPFQGGTDHIHERWPSYWVNLFQARGYVVIDCFRHKIWQHPEVEPWYAQNILLFVQQDQLPAYPALQREYNNTNLLHLTRVHPRIYLDSLENARNSALSLASAQVMPAQQPPTAISQNKISQKLIAEHPLVSVVIPCYNQAHFLPESIASVVAQTYEHWEIIVVNDGSPDHTSEVTQQLITIYSKYTIRLVGKKNGGLPNARNTGIAAANGQYILPLDADDKLSSEALMNLLLLSVQADRPCVAFGSYQMFGNEQKTVISADVYSSDRLKQINMLQVASMYAKDVWQMVNGYKEDEKIAGYEDWEFWLNCQEHQIPFVGTKEIVVYYRRMPGSMVTKAMQQHDLLYAQIVCYHPQLFGDEAFMEAEKLLRAFEWLKPLGIGSVKYLETMTQYQQVFDDPVFLDQLQPARRQIAEYCLSLADDQLEEMYTSTLGQLHQILLRSALKSQPLTDSEQRFVDEIRTNLSKPSDQPQTSNLLAAMLYLHPHQLPQIDLTLLPHWLLSSYLEFVFTSSSEATSTLALEQTLSQTLNQQTAAIRYSLKLRQINLIAFPDWNQPEEQLFSDLVELLRGVITHVDRDRITLLIDTSNGDAAEADSAISNVIMHLLVEEELDLAETGPEISLVGDLKKAQWRVLLSQISARLPLETENQWAIASTGASNLPLQQCQQI